MRRSISTMSARTLVLLALLTARMANTQNDYDDGEEEEAEDESVGIIPFTHFCSFERPMLNQTVTNDDDFCRCDVVTSPMIGRPSIKIDCELSNHVTNLTNEVFRAQKLPTNTVSLRVSYQHFSEVPDFVGDQLKHLDMSNNLIESVKDSNFVHVASLEHLDLSYNQIVEVQPQAFEQLQRLHHLDLSANRFVSLPAELFAPLVGLETLRLASNGEEFARAVEASTSIFEQLGVTTQLRHLALDHCSLRAINLAQGAALKTINLSFNNISDFAALQLPANVAVLDLSGNPVWYFGAESLPHLEHLEQLVLEDLPFLWRVDVLALYGFPRLTNLSFQGSKNLTEIDGHAFGSVDDDNDIDIELQTLNLRGCSFRTFNYSLERVFNQLDALKLEGNPINCNCDARWLKYLKIETNARCHKPEKLAGKLVTEVPDKKLKCENFFMRRLLNTMILLLLLIACSLAIWYFLRQLNPSRRQKFQKVGPDSPYQRVTIEPNRAEYSMY